MGQHRLGAGDLLTGCWDEQVGPIGCNVERIATCDIVGGSVVIEIQ